SEYQVRFLLNWCFHATVTMSAWLWFGAKAPHGAQAGLLLSKTIVVSLCWPGSPFVGKAGAQPTCTLSFGVSTWVANSHVPHLVRSSWNSRSPGTQRFIYSTMPPTVVPVDSNLYNTPIFAAVSSATSSLKRCALSGDGKFAATGTSGGHTIGSAML